VSVSVVGCVLEHIKEIATACDPRGHNGDVDDGHAALAALDADLDAEVGHVTVPTAPTVPKKPTPKPTKKPTKTPSYAPSKANGAWASLDWLPSWISTDEHVDWAWPGRGVEQDQDEEGDDVDDDADEDTESEWRRHRSHFHGHGHGHFHKYGHHLVETSGSLRVTYEGANPAARVVRDFVTSALGHVSPSCETAAMAACATEALLASLLPSPDGDLLKGCLRARMGDVVQACGEAIHGGSSQTASSTSNTANGMSLSVLVVRQVDIEVGSPSSPNPSCKFPWDPEWWDVPSCRMSDHTSCPWRARRRLAWAGAALTAGLVLLVAQRHRRKHHRGCCSCFGSRVHETDGEVLAAPLSSASLKRNGDPTQEPLLKHADA